MRNKFKVTAQRHAACSATSVLIRLRALLFVVWLYPLHGRAESVVHSEREWMRIEPSSRLLFMSEEGLQGLALENSAQVRWRFLSLGPGFRLGSFFSSREQAALFLDLGGGFEHGRFRGALEGRIGVLRQSDVGADDSDWFGDYEPYQGVNVEQGFAGARASLTRLVRRYDIAEVWVGLAAAYERDFRQIEVETPVEAARPGEVEMVGGRRWLFGIELTISIAPWGRQD